LRLEVDKNVAKVSVLDDRSNRTILVEDNPVLEIRKTVVVEHDIVRVRSNLDSSCIAGVGRTDKLGIEDRIVRGILQVHAHTGFPRLETVDDGPNVVPLVWVGFDHDKPVARGKNLVVSEILNRRGRYVT